MKHTLGLSLPLKVAFLALFLSYSTVDGERILLVAMQQRSHINEMVSLGEQLLSGGHEVFLILYEGYPDEPSIITKGIQTVTFKGKTEKPMAKVFREIEDLVVDTVFDGSYANKIPIIMEAVNGNLKDMHDDELMWRSLRALNFDFSMVDGFFYVQAALLVPYHFGIPYGCMFATGSVAWLR